jgi:hypothetical protein
VKRVGSEVETWPIFHMAPDHPWVNEHPDYFVHGSESDLERAQQNYCRVNTENGSVVLAYGRDPYFDGWPDLYSLITATRNCSRR